MSHPLWRATIVEDSGLLLVLLDGPAKLARVAWLDLQIDERVFHVLPCPARSEADIAFLYRISRHECPCLDHEGHGGVM